jgi:hypothetical protein
MISRRTLIAIGIAATVAEALLWHGPLGGAERFARNAEAAARATLHSYEMDQIEVRIERGPMKRRLVLSGTADDFQREEIVRIMIVLPGIGGARWSDPPQYQTMSWQPPMWLEAIGIALVGFGLGLVLAYLIELRRRANASWRW